MNSENLPSTHVPELLALQFTFQSILSICKYVVVSVTLYIVACAFVGSHWKDMTAVLLTTQVGSWRRSPPPVLGMYLPSLFLKERCVIETNETIL